MEPLAIDARLCDRCHGEQRQREGWNHGPINLGTCIPCHRAHESPYPHLLDRPVPQLCLHCHVDALEIMPQYHQVADLEDCTQCHDPHRMY
jgi:predicted CXXCH cytochrome family protein